MAEEEEKGEAAAAAAAAGRKEKNAFARLRAILIVSSSQLVGVPCHLTALHINPGDVLVSSYFHPLYPWPDAHQGGVASNKP